MKVSYKNEDIILPDFLVIGAAKSGTSSLNYWLDNYDDIFMPEPKEPNFFAFENFQMDFEKNIDLKKEVCLYNYNFDEYQALFKGNGEKIIGDASTAYIQFPDNVISNIIKYYGDDYKKLKLLALLRNPISKVYSHYLMFVKWGVETREFKETIIPEYKKVNTTLEKQIDYLPAGYYYEDLKKYKEALGDSLKVWLFDDLVKKQEKTIFDVLEHIGLITDRLPSNYNEVFNEGGIPKSAFAKKIMSLRNEKNIVIDVLRACFPKSIKQNLRKKIDNTLQSNLTYKPKIDDESKEYLRELYSDDIRLTSELISRDLSEWY